MRQDAPKRLGSAAEHANEIRLANYDIERTVASVRTLLEAQEEWIFRSMLEQGTTVSGDQVHRIIDALRGIRSLLPDDRDFEAIDRHIAAISVT